MNRKSKRGRPLISPELRKEQIGLKLSRWLIDWLDTREESRAELIEEALRNRHRLTPPRERIARPGEADADALRARRARQRVKP